MNQFNAASSRARAVRKKYVAQLRLAKLNCYPTHSPHVLVSAKVLLQSRRAKGGFSFCAGA